MNIPSSGLAVDPEGVDGNIHKAVPENTVGVALVSFVRRMGGCISIPDKSVTNGSLSRRMRACRAVAALHAPGLIATSQLSNPRTQQVASRARIA